MTTTAPRIKILIAEDEQNLGTILQQFLAGRGHDVTVTRDGRAALAALRGESFDIALLDIVMPEIDGMEVLRQIRTDPSPPEVIMITGNGTIETAIAAIRLGAYDYLSKPYRMAEIDMLVRRAWEKRQLARENAFLSERLARLGAEPEILGESAAMRAVLEMIQRVARSDSPVLVTGESGTGKELVARALHRHSPRAAAPLVDINCEALAGSLVETELFGYEKGAFAGATAAKEGLLELAAGGTLFMDEIGGLDPRLQGKLLRALEQGSFFRVGGTRKVAIDARVIASTNKNLEKAVAEGTFRSDLLYRINTIRISLPALRERREDIPLLARHFLRRFGGANPPRLGDDAVHALQEYRWPGNVRELRNVIERAVLLAGEGGLIHARELPLQAARTTPPGGIRLDPRLSLAELERRHIETVLQHANWHQGRAAAVLGISSKTLYRKIREYGFLRPAGGAKRSA